MSLVYKSCTNCNASFRADYKHCPHCGLNSEDELSVKSLFSNTIGNYLSVDARIFKSIIPLFFKPGFLATQYIKGKRLKFLAPPQFYLFSTILFFFLFSFEVNNQAENLDRSIYKSFKAQRASKSANDSLKVKAVDSILTQIKDDVEVSIKNQSNQVTTDKPIKKKQFSFNILGIEFKSGMIKEIDSLIANSASDEAIYKVLGVKKESNYFTRRSAKQFVKFYKHLNGGSVFKLFISYIPLALFFLLPIFAFLMKLLFFKRGAYVKHLIFTLYFFSFVFLVLSVIALCSYCNLSNIIENILTFSLLVYFIIAIKKFYLASWLSSVLKGMVVCAVYLAVVLITVVWLFILAFYLY